MPVALPAPYLLFDDTPGPTRRMRVGGATIRRRVAAVAAGFTVAAAPGFTAVAEAASHGDVHRPATSNIATSGSPSLAQPSTVAKATTAVTAVAPHATWGLHQHTWGSAVARPASAATPAPPASGAPHKPGKPAADTAHLAPSHPAGTPDHHIRHKSSSHATTPATHNKVAHHNSAKPKGHTASPWPVTAFRIAPPPERRLPRHAGGADTAGPGHAPGAAHASGAPHNCQPGQPDHDRHGAGTADRSGDAGPRHDHPSGDAGPRHDHPSGDAGPQPDHPSGDAGPEHKRHAVQARCA